MCPVVKHGVEEHLSALNSMFSLLGFRIPWDQLPLFSCLLLLLEQKWLLCSYPATAFWKQKVLNYRLTAGRNVLQDESCLCVIYI